MWTQTYDPLATVELTALAAAVPILFFLVALTALKMKGLNAAAVAVGLSLALAVTAYGMPPGMAVSAGLLGVLNGLWPIAWIILMAVWLYKLAVRSGKFDIIRSSISGVSPDQRVQVLLIAFAFGSFLEGAAGFGVPIAICAALLVELGFKPVKAAMLCLVANAAFGAYGAIGIPVIVGAKQGGVELAELNAMMVVVLQLLTFFIPALLVWILDGFRGVRQMLPMVLLLGLVYSGSQSLVVWLLGPELADIIPALLAMGFIGVFSRHWKPADVYREDGAPEIAPVRHSMGAVLGAWTPFYLLTGFILVWSLPAFKSLFDAADPKKGTEAGALNSLVGTFKMPGLHQNVVKGAELGGGDPLPAAWLFTPVNATGTAILLALLVFAAITPAIRGRALLEELGTTVRELWKPVAMILLVMAVASIANFSGASATIGLALAAAGAAFPLLSPIIGWVGVFITGSVVNNNNLFAGLQAVTAGQIGVNQTLLVAANTTGGVMGKVVSPQSIAISAAAVGLSGQESSIMRAALRYSLGLLTVVCVWTFALSLLIPA